MAGELAADGLRLFHLQKKQIATIDFTLLYLVFVEVFSVYENKFSIGMYVPSVDGRAESLAINIPLAVKSGITEGKTMQAWNVTIYQ